MIIYFNSDLLISFQANCEALYRGKNLSQWLRETFYLSILNKFWRIRHHFYRYSICYSQSFNRWSLKWKERQQVFRNCLSSIFPLGNLPVIVDIVCANHDSKKVKKLSWEFPSMASSSASEFWLLSVKKQTINLWSNKGKLLHKCWKSPIGLRWRLFHIPFKFK